MAEIDQREFGEIVATMRALTSTLAEVKVRLSTMEDTVNTINLTLAESKGGWRMFIGIGTAFFTAGGAVWEAMRHVFIP